MSMVNVELTGSPRPLQYNVSNHTWALYMYTRSLFILALIAAMACDP